MENNFKWYAVQVRGNKENSAKERLEKEITIRGLQKYFKHIYVPLIITANEKTQKKKIVPLLKETMFVNCILTVQAEGLIKSQPDIYGFLGGTAVPIPSSQIIQMIKESGCSDIDGNIVDTTKIEVGDKVIITSTGFNGLNGVVTEISKNGDKVKVDINIFNKTISVEFEKTQIKKV